MRFKPKAVVLAEAEVWLTSRGWKVRFPSSNYYFVTSPHSSVKEQLLGNYELIRLAQWNGYPYRWWKPSTWKSWLL